MNWYLIAGLAFFAPLVGLTIILIGVQVLDCVYWRRGQAMQRELRAAKDALREGRKV